MDIHKSISLPLWSCIWITLVSGCSLFGDKDVKDIKIKPPEPPKIDAIIEASIFLNPDDSGNPSPLLVRTYELSDIAEFKAARFFSLYDEDTRLLGPALKAKREMMILPGEKKKLIKELNPNTRYFGIIGAYQKIDHAIWRAILKTPPDRTTSVTIRFDKIRIYIFPRKE
ncbi:MAG: type VI secretion system lipoprotein TssJ [Gammaproteobacteria bacterium]|nr:type VI secretion system lipoprotein TssJ [Gammaproteobacteria bacterium]